MKRTPLICPLLALALPALAHVAATTKLSVDYENAAFTNVLADISAKVEAATPEDPFGFLIRLDPSVTNDLPAITLRADDIELGALLSKLDALTGLEHRDMASGFCFMPPPPPPEPVRTLKEAARRLRDYKSRAKGEALFPYSVKTDASTDETATWTFFCESHSWNESPDPFDFSDDDGEASEIVQDVVLRIDSSGEVRELSREPSEARPYPHLWIPVALNYCQASGIDPETVSELAADAGTNLVFVVGTNAPVRVSYADVARAEKAHFFATIAEADRIVIRDGGFDCCVPVETIDGQRVLAVITNAAEVAAFTAMIRFKDGSGLLPCWCCGHPGIDWWKGDERVALTAVQHGRALRWRAFSDDYPFTEESAQALARWFEEHGVRLGPDAP